MQLEQLLKSIERGETEKTASSQDTTPNTDDQLKAALGRALEKVAGEEQTKEAADADPVDALLKIANDLEGVEKQAEIELATSMGRAFADAAVNRWAEFNGQLKQAQYEEQQKLASMQAGYQTGQQMLADADMQIKQAQAQGNHALAEKLAADQYNAGQEAALVDIHNTAAIEFLKGAAEIETITEALAQESR